MIVDFVAMANAMGQTFYDWFVRFNALFFGGSDSARLLVFVVDVLCVMVGAEVLVLVVYPFIRGLNPDYMYLTRHVQPDFRGMPKLIRSMRRSMRRHGIHLFEHTPPVTSYGVPYQGFEPPDRIFPDDGLIDWGTVWRDSMPSHVPTLPNGSFPVVPFGGNNGLSVKGGLVVRGPNGVGGPRRAVNRDASGNPDFIIFGNEPYTQVSGNVYEQEKMPDGFVGYWNDVYYGPRQPEAPDIFDASGRTVGEGQYLGPAGDGE